MTSTSQPIFQIEPKVLFNYTLRYWYLLLIGLICGVSYAYYKVRYTPPTYSVNSRMLVKDEYSSWGQEYFLPGMELVSERNRLVNEIGMIRSFHLMERVSKKLDIRFSYFKVGNIKTTEMYPNSEFTLKLVDGDLAVGKYYIDFPRRGYCRINQDYDVLSESPEISIDETLSIGPNDYEIQINSSAVYGEGLYSFTINSIGGLARQLQSNIQIEVEDQESSILVLSHRDLTPSKSLDYLNSLMEEYIQWGRDQNNEITSNTIAFLDEQLKDIADSLVLTEHRLEQTKKKISEIGFSFYKTGITWSLFSLWRKN